MNERHRLGQAVLIGVMVYYAIAITGWAVVMWGALADWEMAYGVASACGVASVIFGIWMVARWTWVGLLPRWVGAFCCGGVLGLIIIWFAFEADQPRSDPAAQANWKAKFGWVTPTGYAVGGLAVATGFLLYVSPVSRFLDSQRSALR